jgi:hypothetical protein
VIVAVGVVLLAGVGIASATLSGSSGADSLPVPDVSDSTGQRVRVQVLNATTTRGLARRATMVLRDRGFDVVEMGTSATQLDSTLVLDRSGHPDWARRVADALGGARVEARPDSSRYLDVTVLLGRSWRPPTEPFYP